ncbi:hypothetical protein CIY_34680 [Butyrivibrio fibrisolvens 16/4]|nr:hypothetical protein CIY_34680 [Butyrivibrio fibrisolvens 16/4]
MILQEETKNGFKNQREYTFYFISWLISVLCYLPFIANYITNSMDGLWQETYHQAANWEISTGRWAWPF